MKRFTWLVAYGALGVLFLIPSVTAWAQQRLSLPQPITSFVNSDAYFVSGDLKFSGFEIVTDPLETAIDTKLMDSLFVENGDTSGYGGLVLRFSQSAKTNSTALRRALPLRFKVEPILGAPMQEIHLTFAGTALQTAFASSIALLIDNDPEINKLQSIEVDARAQKLVPSTPSYVARRVQDTPSKTLTNAVVLWSFVIESALPPSVASLDYAALRISNGQQKLSGDSDLNGVVDGRDFLLWQRTYGTADNLVADASSNSIVDAADLTIWHDNYGKLIGAPADFDGDGDVDGRDFLKWQRGGSPNPLSASDLAEWRANYETQVGSQGDFDRDGDVDGRDFLAWQRNPSVGSLADWQSQYGSNPLAAVTIPEPAVLTLALLSLVLLIHPRRVTHA